jgi:hypothetical protein
LFADALFLGSFFYAADPVRGNSSSLLKSQCRY